jgi:hypothetical protein
MAPGKSTPFSTVSAKPRLDSAILVKSGLGASEVIGSTCSFEASPVG